MRLTVNICWFRRDLRLVDNAALYHALKSDQAVVPVFIFDKNILNDLEDKLDKRVAFIREALLVMQQDLNRIGSALEVYYDTPMNVFKALLTKYAISNVYANEDYEQYAIDRDEDISGLLKKHNAALRLYKDQVIFSKKEVVKDDGRPYTVYTPYSRKWKAALTDFHLKSYPTEKYFKHFHKQSQQPILSLERLGFENTDVSFPSKEVSSNLIQAYKDSRDYPAIQGTSHLGVHLRFGTISIRSLARQAHRKGEVFLNELIWRDFYQMILSQYPHVRQSKAFKPEYDFIQWRNSEQEFEAWCNGATGYPIVDAGMRELNATGYMHNRVRMIVASFLTKHLLIDWRWGEAYFAKKLLDYDYAANNGGWQWAAGSGCDAAPYFRVFNPTLQTQKFDKDLVYIRTWVPELDTFEYPAPIVDHAFARERVLKVYKAALKK